MPVVIKYGQSEISGFLTDDLNIRVKTRIEIFFTFRTRTEHIDFQELKNSKMVLTLILGKSVFTGQIIQYFETSGDVVKMHTMSNRGKRAEDFERW
jgi:hypothetical protein